MMEERELIFHIAMKPHLVFLSGLACTILSSMIYIECKNYGKEVGNPELDQLSGRFSISRGKVGILVCRSIENKEKLYQSCKDTAKDDRGYILPLDDDDILMLIEEYQTKNDQLFPHLRKLWMSLIG